MIIYKVTNKINGKVYIGQTTRSIKSRWKGHCRSAENNKSNNMFHSAIAKYGPDAFIVEQVDFANDIDTLNKLEKHHIEEHESLYPNGYNMKTGGLNCEYSDASKKKMSEAKLGTNIPIDVKNKMSEVHKERWKDISLRERKSETSKRAWQDQEYRDKITKARKEYWKDPNNREEASKRAKETASSQEYRDKISEAVKQSFTKPGTKKKLKRFRASQEKAVVDSSGGVHRSIKSAAETLGLRGSSIIRVIKGQYKHSGGYTFKYLQDAYNEKPVMYVVAGAPGAGKSWVCNNFDKTAYVSYDKTPKEDQRFELMSRALNNPVIFDPCVGVSTCIKEYEDVFDVRLLVICEDVDIIKSRLLNRGGKITDSILARIKRMESLAKLATFSGTSQQVLEYLQFKHSK